MTEKTKLSRLDVLREFHKRNGLDKQQQDELTRLEAGEIGEQTVASYIEKLGQPHWKIMTNVWLDYYGPFECDLILITSHRLYPFEIKNYSGVYEFKNSQCIQNGHKIGHNAISQAQKSAIHFQNLMRQNGLDRPMTGVIVFAGEDCEVKVYDEIDDLKVLQRNQLRNFIWQIAKEERESFNHPIDAGQMTQFIEKVRIDSPFPPAPITDEMTKRMRKGILCSHCGSFNVDTTKSYISCQCGMHEPKENAIVRTICEYGIIHFDKDLITSEVHDFFNGQVSRFTILETLKKHFTRIGSNRKTIYINNPMPFAECYTNFSLVKSRTLQIEQY